MLNIFFQYGTDQPQTVYDEIQEYLKFMIIAGYVLAVKERRRCDSLFMRIFPLIQTRIYKMFLYFVGYIIDYNIDQPETSYNKR